MGFTPGADMQRELLSTFQNVDSKNSEMNNCHSGKVNLPRIVNKIIIIGGR